MLKSLVYALAVILALGGFGFVFYLIGFGVAVRKAGAGGISPYRREKLLHRASSIMSMLGVSTSIEEPEMLRPITRLTVNKWLDDYRRETTK